MRRWGSCVLLVLLTVAGCGALDAPSTPATPAKLKIIVLPTVETAPLRLAERNGYFKAEGLEIEVTTAGSGPVALNGMLAGDFDIAHSSYVPFLNAQSSGVADIKIIAPSSSSAPNTAMLVTPPDSALHSMKDMAGRTIAVSGRNSMADLMVKANLKAAGVDAGTVKWVEVPFPDMTARLGQKDVDAAMMVEPFATFAKRKVNAIPLQDLANGTLTDVPLTGYGATRKFVESHRDQVAAFQRAMRKAAAEAKDRGKIQPLFTEYAKVDKDTAAETALPVYDENTDPVRITRVADLLREYGVLQKPVDVAAMCLQ
jgi:NitT/TauT family transport system substrate-binding protein